MRWLPAVVLLLYAVPASAQAWDPERVEAQMIATGRDAGPAPGAGPLPLVEERLQVSIDGQHATTTLLQAYQNQSGAQIEGRYTLRAGTSAHVEGFAYWNGETKIVGEVFERATARRVYDNVTQRRRDPGLLEQTGDGAFSFQVFPIEPRERKRIELRWTKWLDRRARTVRYHAPITRPDASIVVTIAGAIQNVRSSTHALHVEKLPDGVRLRGGAPRARGELVLEWEAAEPDWTPTAVVHAGGRGPGGEALDGWFALALAAPDLPASAVTAKDVTIVIDRSGSMSGEPMEQARAAALDMVRRLPPTDRVNVVAFSDEVDPLFRTPQPLDAATRQRAVAFLQGLHEGGGTDIALALSTAIRAQESGRPRPRVIVFMTDGQSDIDQAIAAARTDTGDSRIFTLGLGKDVNSHLLARLAATKRGRYVHIERTSSIQTEVARLAAQIDKPLLIDVSVEVDGAQALKLYPRTLPDLFAQDQLLVTGRLRGTGPTRFTIRGKLAGQPVAFSRTVNPAAAPARPWVGRLWAQARVAHLLEDMSLEGAKPELQGEVTELALAYNFVTPYTSFLAIPESELGAEATTVAAARERKRKIMANHADAAALDRRDFGSAKLAVSTVDAAANAPSPAGPASPASPVDTGNSDDEDGGAGGPPDDSDDQGEGEMVHIQDTAPTSRSSLVPRKTRGCAGCASGGGSGGDAAGLLGLWLVVAALVLRRRRRALR